ncbi:MAG TPA: hypothetical protein VMR08_02220 [Patescibacteria group bacterium]|jgi:type II secretory pathway pseudopilin PulG|nr:hypothetical protein [Patescibacteria group bacterium]
MIKKLNHTGDTIIEVLLAITIASFVLAAAVVSADSSLNTERQSQNRSIAIQITQSQIEELEAYYTNEQQIFQGYIANLNGNSFCMNPSTSAPEPAPTDPLTALPPTTCYFSQSDVYYATAADVVAAAGGPWYAVTVTFDRNDLGQNPALYQASVTATWAQTGTGSSNSVTADYRLN